MKSNILEIYKCAALTVISILLGFILWRMAERPMTVYVKGGNIDVDNEVGVEIVDPLPVEVQNVVDVSIQ
jgi:hypothetical protein